MPAPLKPHLYPVVLHDQDAVPAGTASNPIYVTVSGGGGGTNVIITGVVPGTIIDSQADTAVAALDTSPLPSPPAGTRRMTIQNTGPVGSQIRVRQVGGAAGSGVLLTRFGSTSFGGADGALADLEAEDVADSPGIATTVGVTFEED